MIEEISKNPDPSFSRIIRAALYTIVSKFISVLQKKMRLMMIWRQPINCLQSQTQLAKEQQCKGKSLANS